MTYRIVLISLIIFLIVALAVYYYVFNIFDVTVKVFPADLYSDVSSKVTIEVIPVNALGKRVPFRMVNAEIEIVQGKELVEILTYKPERGILVLRSNEKPGVVEVIIKSKYSLLPMEVEIPVVGNYSSVIF